MGRLRRGRLPFAMWIKTFKAVVGVGSTLWLLRDLGRFMQGVSDVRRMVAAGGANNAPDLGDQAKSLARDLAELAHKCSEPRADLDRRGYGPWRTPETLELSIAWYKLLQIAAQVADFDVQYGQDLRVTDPTMPVITSAPLTRRKQRGIRLPFNGNAGAQPSSEFGQPARGTVPALTGRLARQLDREFSDVFRKTARAAQDIVRHLQLPKDQPVTAFTQAEAIARVHAMNEWLEEQVQRIQRQYRIGLRASVPLK